MMIANAASYIIWRATDGNTFCDRQNDKSRWVESPDQSVVEPDPAEPEPKGE
jgi:hypothetical protein